MARTMKWPPTPIDGRIPFVDGVDATTILVAQTLSDLQTNPFNDPLLSLGNITFMTSTKARPRIEGALRRLRPLIDVEAIIEDRSESDEGTVKFTVNFLDREVRQRSEVIVNG